MSKIICDICGTSYADTANQCPICGTVRPVDLQSVQDDLDAPEYTYVKGGRFSKKNVRKRNAGKPFHGSEKSSGAKIGLIVALVALILIVIAIAAYVVMTLSGGDAVPTATEPAVTQPLSNPCQAIILPQKEIRLENIGDTLLLDARKSPVNSTDEFVFISSDSNIVTVDSQGMLRAIGNGTAVVTIVCGDVNVECEIIVGKEEEPPLFQLNRQEITFTQEGETWMVYSGQIPLEDITWTSDDEAVAIVSDGLIIAIGEGQTNISATYLEETIICPVSCVFSANDPTSSGGITEDIGGIGEDVGDIGGIGGIGEDTGDANAAQKFEMFTIFGGLLYNDYLNAYDVTIRTGEEIQFFLKSDNKTLDDVSWTLPDDATCCTLGDGTSIVTGVSAGDTYLSASYNGQTVKCYIRVY